jgi:hypothetical protein
LNTFFNRIVGFLRGPLSLILIITYYSESDQGYWYLFINLGVISTVIDFGLASLLTQKISRVYGREEDQNSNQSITQVYLIIRQFVKYYLILTTIFVIYTILIFLHFLDQYNYQWLVYGGLLVLQFSLTPLYHIYMGLNKVQVVQSALFKGNLIGSITLLCFLWLGYGLWSLGIAILISVVITGILFLRESQPFWRSLIKIAKKDHSSVAREDLKTAQLDYFLSWTAGIFMYNFFIPYISKVYDIILTGKIGLILSLFSFILSLSVVFAYNNIPRFNIMIERNQIKEAYILYKNILLKSALLFLGLLFSAYMSMMVLNKFIPLKDRLPEQSIIIYIAVWIAIRVFTSASASFFRSFGGEPYRNLNILLLIITILIYVYNYLIVMSFKSFIILIVFTHLIFTSIYYLYNFRNWLAAK